MRIFKSKWFNDWSNSESLDDSVLKVAIEEIIAGLIDAELGGNVVKKRVRIAGFGKRSGFRTLIAFKSGDKAFYIFGFAKNARDNVTAKELKAIKALAKKLLTMRSEEINAAVRAGSLYEIK